MYELSHVQLFETLWTKTRQALLSMGLFQQEYWNGLPFPSPGNLSEPGSEPVSPALAGGFFTTGKPFLFRLGLVFFYLTLYRQPILSTSVKNFRCLSL